MQPHRSSGRPVAKRLDLLVFLAAAAAVVLFWQFVPGEWTMEANNFRDYYGYYGPVGENLASGKGLLTPEGTPATLYPPGYPMLLAALRLLAAGTGIAYETWLALFTLSSVALAAVLLFNIAWRIVGLRCAWITVALWISYPSALWLSKQPSSDTAFLPFFYAALLLFLPLLLDETDNAYSAALAGAVMGMAVLVRPIAMFAAPVLGLCLAYYGSRESWWRRVRPALALLAGCAAVLAPWETWAWYKTGAWIPVSTNGPASISDGLTQVVNTDNYRHAVDVPVGVRLIMEDALARRREHRLHSRADVFDFFADAARERPLQLMQLLWWKAKRTWYGTDSMRGEERWLAWMHIVYLALSVGGAVLLWQGAGSGRRWLTASGLLVLYYWAMTVLALTLLRYMLPVAGLMFVWQAVLLERVWQHWRSRKPLAAPLKPAGR